MKKALLTIITIFIFGYTNAQEAKFGIKGGLNLANVNFTGDNSSLVNPKTLYGFHIGGFVEIKVSDTFSFQPELLYSSQGFTEDETGYIDGYYYDAEGKTKLDYLNIPLMAKFYATKQFSLEFGPQIGILLSAKQEFNVTVKNGNETFSDSSSEDIKDDLKSSDFGLNFGAGYDFTEKFSAGLRYNVGLSNIADFEDQGNSKAKNNVFSLSVGYKF